MNPFSKVFPLFGFIILLCACTTSETTRIDDSPIIPDAESNCEDGVRNGDETGVDCGGSSCNACPEIRAEIPPIGAVSPTSYEGYSLIWSDEFDSKELTSEKWSFHLASGCPNLCGWGNNELQYYTDDNFYFDEGNLIISARNEPISGFDYSSTRIHTDNKFEFQYGRVDIRAAMPSATGTWVALWMINKDYSIQNPAELWPSGGEIDIIEFLGEDRDAAFGTAHFGEDLSAHRFISGYYDAPSKNYDEEFYVYSIIWEEDKITWLINDIPYHTITPDDTANQPYPFNDAYYLILNLSVGGNLPVAPVEAEYPDFLIVDYIRVFQ